MSELRADTITGSDGTSPVTLTKQSAAKAWVNFNGTGTIATRDSFNVSSLTDNGAGNYDVFHINNMSDSNYSFNISTDSWIRFNSTQSTSSHRPRCANSAFSSADAGLVHTSVHGDLA